MGTQAIKHPDKSRLNMLNENAKSKISRLQLISVSEQVGLSLT